MKHFLLLATLLLLCGPSSAQVQDLYANDGTYLGNTGSQYDANSVNNPYGKYGSQYSPNSINNQYGQYGSQYSMTSPNDRYAAPGVAVPQTGGVRRQFGGWSRF